MSQKLTKSNFDKLTGRSDGHLTRYQGYLLHPSLITKLTELQKRAKTEINADLAIISGFRHFDIQQQIWNNKLTGKKPVLDDNDKILSPENFSKRDFIEKIMRFSMIPGASRHHWGSDFDVYDASKEIKANVQLTPSECTEGAIFGELHAWLDENIENKRDESFFRPYAHDLGGVACEKWHISYRPVSQELNELYSMDIFIRNLEESNILSKSLIKKESEYFFEQYVKNISI